MGLNMVYGKLEKANIYVAACSTLTSKVGNRKGSAGRVCRTSSF